jgi:mannosyltransferase
MIRGITIAVRRFRGTLLEPKWRRTMTSAAPAGTVTPGQDGGQPSPGRWSRLRSRRAGLLMLLPAVVELFVGGYKIGSPSLWRDEADTLSASTGSVHYIFALLHREDAVHAAYYVLMHYVVAVSGTSATALRLPSLLATAAAASMTAVLGRRLARSGGLPVPGVTGTAAGLLFVAMPRTTWYAQDARPYAIATLLAVVATYLLVRGFDDGRVRWWVCYFVAIVLLAAMNLLALVILVPHALSLLAARRPGGWPGETTSRVPPVRRAWLSFLVAAGAAIACLIPLALLADGQTNQISWLARPGLPAVKSLLADFSGTKALIPLIFGLAVLCLALEAARWRAPGWTLGKVALPWLVLPPAILIVISRVHTPIYDGRYVLFCMPAIALLAAGGLTGLGRVIGPLLAPAGWIGAAVPVLIAGIIAVLLIGPQQQVRLTAARPDNLAAVAAFIAPREQPGDAIMYLPWDAKVVSQAYPAAYTRLRDIAQHKSPRASATLRGTTVSVPVLARRFAAVGRLWVIQLGGDRFRNTRLDQEERKLLRQLRQVGIWHISDVTLTLFVRP